MKRSEIQSYQGRKDFENHFKKSLKSLEKSKEKQKDNDLQYTTKEDNYS